MQTKRRNERDVKARAAKAAKGDYEFKPRTRKPEERQALRQMKAALAIRHQKKAEVINGLHKAEFHTEGWRRCPADTLEIFAIKNGTSAEHSSTRQAFETFGKLINNLLAGKKRIRLTGKNEFRWGNSVIDANTKPVQVYLQ